MTTEPLSASLVSSLSLPGSHQMPQAYYRSKLFIAPFTTNPLVAAAGPLLSLLERLCISPTLPPVTTIRDNIEHELRAFHSSLNGKAYTEELDAVAHYLLCATIDELLAKNYLRVYGKLTEFRAFTPITADNIGLDTRFFEILHYIKERPNQYLDLIELSYYCLIIGFEGKHHFATNGRQILDDMLEELFQIIQQYRVNKPHRLFRESKKIDLLSKTNYRPVIAALAICFSVLFTGYFGSYLLLENKAKMVQFGHTVLAKLDD